MILYIKVRRAISPKGCPGLSGALRLNGLGGIDAVQAHLEPAILTGGQQNRIAVVDRPHHPSDETARVGIGNEQQEQRRGGEEPFHRNHTNSAA
ncbi:MAG: hypothetical protein ABSA86_07210 [Oryzomonas sp.]|jgi:hypothetical protein